jgi:hypothetical protein
MMTDDAPAFVTFAAYARLHHVSRPTVHGWRKRGYLVLQDGRVDVVRSNERLAARPDVHRGGVAKVRPGKPAPIQSSPAAEGEPADGWSMHEAKRREMVAVAKMREQEQERLAGLVVLKAEVLGAVSSEYTVVRTRMLGLASRLAHRLAACTSPEGCSALVDTEVRLILQALVADGGAR